MTMREAVVRVPALLPVISASIYCHGFLDPLLRDVIAPFWKSTRTTLPQSGLWVIRYPRGGQHLKLRLHVPADEHVACAAHLQDAVETFFSGLPAPSKSERDTAAHLPPIDPEDGDDGLRPDRSLIWTRYRHLPELIGAEPLSAANGFEAAYVRCLIASTQVVLDWLDTLGSSETAIGKQMSIALKLLLAAAAGIHPNPETRAQYFAYQRDWLLRVSLNRELALELFEVKAGKLSAQQSTLGLRLMEPPPCDGALGLWARAVGDLVRFCLDQVGQQDLSKLNAESGQLVYFAISRLVHNAMNPTGIGASNEAYLCHLLRSALVRTWADGGPSS